MNKNDEQVIELIDELIAIIAHREIEIEDKNNLHTITTRKVSNTDNAAFIWNNLTRIILELNDREDLDPHIAIMLKDQYELICSNGKLLQSRVHDDMSTFNHKLINAFIVLLLTTYKQTI